MHTLLSKYIGEPMLDYGYIRFIYQYTIPYYTFNPGRSLMLDYGYIRFIYQYIVPYSTQVDVCLTTAIYDLYTNRLSKYIGEPLDLA